MGEVGMYIARATEFKSLVMIRQRLCSVQP